MVGAAIQGVAVFRVQSWREGQESQEQRGRDEWRSSRLRNRDIVVEAAQKVDTHKVGTLWKWVKSVSEEWRWQCSRSPLNVLRIE